MTSLKVTAMTHRGAVRADNEDALVIGSLTACGVTMSNPITCEIALSSPVLVAVADGMGGHAGGAVASAHTARALAAASPQDGADLVAALKQIDADLQAVAEADPTVSGLGTTVAAVLLAPEGGIHFGIGDSRVYLADGGYLAQVSTDHRGPGGGLTQCLGGRADATPLRITTEPLTNTDRLLICSDGLSDLVSLETMEKLLNTSYEPVRIVRSLWAAAMNASGHDNITVVLVEYVTKTTFRDTARQMSNPQTEPSPAEQQRSDRPYRW